MIKEKTIVFDNNLKFNLQDQSLIDPNTEILNLMFFDHCNSNAVCCIGNNLEWIPSIWLTLETEKISRCKEINIVSLLGDLSLFAEHCKKLFPNSKVNYYHCNLFWQIRPIKESLSRVSLSKKSIDKKLICNTSIGIMRLNRYMLVKYALANNLQIFYPAITKQESAAFEYQIEKCTEQKKQELEIPVNRAHSENMNEVKFNDQHFEAIQQSFLNFVPTFPNTDFLRNAHDEKYFDTILAKTIPFVLAEKNSNKDGFSSLGFVPYEGFDWNADSETNAILRWQKLLHNNSKYFNDIDYLKLITEKNKKNIEFNYERFTTTDWQQERKIQYDALPTLIQEKVDLINWK